MPRLSVTVGGLVLPYCLVCRMPSGPVEMYSTGSTSVLIPDNSLKDATWMPSTWMTKVDADMTVGLPPATGAMAKCSFLVPSDQNWAAGRTDQPSPYTIRSQAIVTSSVTRPSPAFAPAMLIFAHQAFCSV